MSSLFALLTLFLLAIPGAMLLGVVSSDGIVRFGMLGTAGFMAFVYAAVWFWWRPSHVEVDARGLDVVFPLRRRSTSWGEVRRVSLIDRQGLRARFGRTMRVGAGGLWGGFGWLKASKGGWIEFYISRLDGMVLVERAGRSPLLVTTKTPGRLVDAIREQTRGAPARTA